MTSTVTSTHFFIFLLPPLIPKYSLAILKPPQHYFPLWQISKKLDMESSCGTPHIVSNYEDDSLSY